jgi:hypothetical protein
MHGSKRVQQSGSLNNSIWFVLISSNNKNAVQFTTSYCQILTIVLSYFALVIVFLGNTGVRV